LYVAVFLCFALIPLGGISFHARRKLSHDGDRFYCINQDDVWFEQN